MSMIAAAMRLTAVQALTNATSAADRVHDSAVDPIELVKQDGSGIRIIVSTDKGGEDDDGAKYVLLNFDLFIASGKKVTLDNGDAAIEIDFDLTDANSAAALDELAFEVDAALSAPAGAWADLFRAFIPSIKRCEWESGAVAQGQRLAYYRKQLRVVAREEPMRGALNAPEGGLWRVLIEAMESSTDPHVAKRGALWRSLLTVGTYAEWQADMARRGLSIVDARALGFAPIEGSDTLDPDAPLTAIALEDQDRDADVIVEDAVP